MAVQSFVYVQYVARQFGDDVAKCMYVVVSRASLLFLR